MATTITSLQELGQQKGFKVLSLNVRSLFKKIDQCRAMLDHESLDIISFSETWLNSSIPTAALDISGYHSVRQDRNFKNTSKKRGGGLITYIHQKHMDKLQVLPELSMSNPNCEALWIRLNMPHCKDIILCNIYRPPSGKINECVDYLERCLSSINTNKTDVFILGDVNVDYSKRRTADYKKLSFFIKSNQLVQKIVEHTRVTNKSNAILDLVITNCKYVSESGTLPAFLSDHQPIFVVRKKGRDGRPIESFVGRSYRNFNEDHFKATLSGKDWENIIDHSTVDSAWSTLFAEIMRELDAVCPYKKFKVKSHRPAWMDVHLIEQMKDRDYFYKKATLPRKEHCQTLT